MSIHTGMSKGSSYCSISTRERSLSRAKRPHIADGFVTTFNTYCQEAEMVDHPSVTILGAEPISWIAQLLINERLKPAISLSTSRMVPPSNEKRLTASEILAIYNDPENEGLIHMLVYKHFPMRNDLMGVLQKTFVNFQTLKVLKLEYCNLTSDQLRAVKHILTHNENIVDLSLDGNPIGYQNHYILLKNTPLRYLSLKFCKINIRGITKLAIYLEYPSANKLFGLDLSNNFVKDDGCKLLADALRTNRSLTHLALANNLISDKGCEYLMEVLQRFSLTHEEILLRRKCNMEYLLRRKIAIEEAKLKKPHEIPNITASTQKSDKKGRPSVGAAKNKKGTNNM